MPTGQRSLAEAVVWLCLARLAILLLPFRLIAPQLGTHRYETPVTDSLQTGTRVLMIAGAMQRASRHLPWKCTCLVQALAGKVMLRRRGLPSTLYLGVAKNGDGNLCAHAWLRCGNFILTGQEEATRFTVVSTFGDE